MSNTKIQTRYKPQFFTTEELQKCTPACNILDMVDDVFLKLDIARALYDKPIHITSAYRSKEWELAHGRPGTSSHVKGLAVDIYCNNSKDRYRLVKSLMFAGFFRIGIAETFIHADIDTSKPAGIWLYPPK